jgi:ribonuclease III
MGKGTAAAGARTPLRPVSELLEHLTEVTGGPVDEALLGRALTHRSYAYEAGGLPHNERLEFLGDSVLGLVVTTTLYDANPEESEGQLAKLRAAVVNMRALADVGRTLGLGDYVYLGRGEESTGGRDKDSILADTVEAVIGAVYQSAGILAAGELVHHLIDPLLAQSATLGAGLDWKTSLQEITSRHGLGAPEYAVTEDGPEHAKWFQARVVVGGDVLGTGSGRTKKVAEQEAAALAWTSIRDTREGPVPGVAEATRPSAGAPSGGVPTHGVPTDEQGRRRTPRA